MQKYSVLMSIYKEEKSEYFKKSIESMLNQTILPDEIILVLDGPVYDDLENTIDEYKKRLNEKLKIIKLDENVGLGSALNIGMRECKNELIARMDSDDISKENRCEQQLLEFKKNPNLDIVGSFVDEFNKDITRIISTRKVPIEQKKIYNFSKRRSAFNHPTVMYKKSSVLKCDGYSNKRRNQDVDLFGRMLFQGCVAVNISQSLLYFRVSEDSVHRRRNWINTKSYIQTIFQFWKMGYSSIFDFIIVLITQLIIFVIPHKFQKIIYKKFLRS